MNVYDFDDTLFDHNSTSGFYFFLLKRDLSLLRFLPRQLVGFIGYGLHLIDITRMKSYLYCFLKGVKDPAGKAEEFWDLNIGHIHHWYKDRQRPDDLVISGSPEFIVKPACDRLKISRLIGSEVDPASGRVLSPNCSGANKVIRLKASPYQDEIEEFYSDSRHDQPLASLARQAWLVKGEKLIPWPWGQKEENEKEQ